MPNKAKHAFGSASGVDAALSAGKINAYDILFLNGENESPKVGWIDKNGNKVIVEGEEYVIKVDSLPTADGKDGVVYIYNNAGYVWNGTECVPLAQNVDLSGLEAEVAKKADAEEVNSKIDTAVTNSVNTAKAYTDGKVEAAVNEHLVKKYKITNTPEGTLINYGEKEIRVMCPADTTWVKQTVGATGNANMYYMGFKAYAPEGAVSFKEGDQGVVKDEMFTFDDDFAGTDEYGRNYSICWLALALYDEDSNTWTYFGKNSSTSKYIGWTYVVEWYDANGAIIAFDTVRINLSNENCHSSIEPFYVGSIMKEVDTKIEEKIAEVESAMEVIEF